MSTQNDYLNMQKSQYNKHAANWSLNKRDPVVGSYDKHNAWEDYKDFLFKDIDTQPLIALDYGSGPGRNIVTMDSWFTRVDGCDISEVNKQKAKVNTNHAGISDYNYYVCDGKSIPCEDSLYDVVFSVICLQHIAVHEVRYAIMEEVYRVLKTGGHFCFQMGYGGKPDRIGKKVIRWAKYHDNYYDALGTNGWCDVSIEDENDLKADLEKIGFTNFNFDVRPTGPGDNHRNWIFVRVQK